MTDWIDYTQCSECGKQCQNGGHCIGGVGGKDTKCPGFIRYVPKIRVEKDVWESTLHHSMVLQAEHEELKEILERHKKATAKAQIRSCDLEIINAQLKELLKRAGIYAWNCGDTKLANKINEVLNE